MSIAIVTTQIPSLFAGVYDSVPLAVTCSGAAGTYFASVVSGSLAPGLQLNISGNAQYPVKIYGTATATGSFTFTLRVENYSNSAETDTRTFTVYVTAGHLIRNTAGHLTRSSSTGRLFNRKRGTSSAFNPPVITTVSLASATVSSPYGFQMSASGGSTPYTWSVLSGALPAGLSLSSAGYISGTTAAAPGSYSVTIKCAGIDSAFDSKAFTLTLVAAPTNVLFTLETGYYAGSGATNYLFIYDPGAYGYSCHNDVPTTNPLNYWPYPGQSMPLQGNYCWFYTSAPPYNVSPNGGVVGAYSASAPVGYPLSWQGGSSPSGIYKFWVERTNGASPTAISFRYRIYLAGSLFWERTGAGTAAYSASRRYTQLWTFNSSSGQVS
jgi:hypothetical protein